MSKTFLFCACFLLGLMFLTSNRTQTTDSVEEKPKINGSSGVSEYEGKSKRKTRDSVVSNPREQNPSASEPTFPEPIEATSENSVVRIWEDHFRTHPSTSDRMLHLLSLADKKHQEQQDLVDIFNKIKRNSIDIASDLAAEAVGKFTLEQEWEIGDRVHKQLTAQMDLDEEAAARIRLLAQPILEKVERTLGRPYTFTVVRSKKFNAFAHLGGYIYVNQGLLDKVTDNVHLQFVLAHEIAHVEREHCSKAVLFGEKASEFAGDPAGFAVKVGQMVTRVGYSYQNEKDADSWAYWRMKDLEYTDEQVLTFFKIMAKQERNR